MLQSIRDRATGWIAYTIIILICIPFALWGINSYFDTAVPQDAASVDGVPIPIREVQRVYQQQRAQQQQRLGGNIDLAPFEATLREQSLQQLIDDAVLGQTARRHKMRIGDAQLGQAIQQIPEFQQDGVFQPERYQRMLYTMGFSAPQFEESYRNDLAVDQLRQGLIDSSLVTEQELEKLAELWHQQRDVSYLRLSLAAAKEGIELSDEELQTFYDENQNRFMSPERLKVRYLELDLDKLAAAQQISDEDLQAAYEQRRDQYTEEAQRRASHVLFTLPADADDAQLARARERAETLYQELQGDKTFDQAVAELQGEDGVEAGEIGVIYPGMMESDFERALFALEQTGAVTEPVRTSNGIHIVRLDEYRAAQVTPLEDVRDELTGTLQRERVENDFFDAAEQLATLTFENPDSLQQAGDELGLEVQESDWFTRTEGEGVAQFAAVRQAAFGDEVLQQNLNSEAIEVTPSRVVVVRKAEHEPAAALSFDQAREQIEQQLLDQRAREALAERVEQLLAEARDGAELAALAEADGVELEQPGLIKRTDAAVERAVVTEAFKLPKPAAGEASYGTATLSNGDRAVVAVTDIQPGKLADVPEPEQDFLRRQVSSQIGASQFNAFLQSRRQQADIEIYSNRQREGMY